MVQHSQLHSNRAAENGPTQTATVQMLDLSQTDICRMFLLQLLYTLFSWSHWPEARMCMSMVSPGVEFVFVPQLLVSQASAHIPSCQVVMNRIERGFEENKVVT